MDAGVTGEERGSAAGEPLADFLGHVPLLAALPREARAELAGRAREVHIAAGAYVFHEGERGDSLFVVRSGRLGVEVPGPGSEVMRDAGRGETVGELALLTGDPLALRSASVRALRDSTLVEIRRADFDALVEHRPELALALARDLARRLRESRGLPPAPPGPPATIALVPLETGPPADEIADRLLAELERGGRALRLTGEELGDLPVDDEAVAARFGPLLDHAERDHDHVLLVARPPLDDPWTAFCLRQADRVLALGESGRPPRGTDAEPLLRGADVVLHGEPFRAARCAAWLDAVEGRAVHLLRRGAAMGDDVARLGRRLGGRSLGVVLSGGGARGFAHLGVLEELGAAGVEVDRVGGCSMGAYVGALFAMGMPVREAIGRCRAEFVERNPLGDYTVPRVALLRGNRGVAMLERTFGSLEIEELRRAYFCVSADLVTAELVVHRRGPLAPAVGASMCLPAILPPRRREERLLVDGGVLSNLPVEPMAAEGEGPVVAVDVTGPFRVPDEGPTALPGLKETLARAIAVGSVQAVEAARRRADVLVTPPVEGVGMLQWDALDAMVEAGRAAAREALPRIAELAAT